MIAAKDRNKTAHTLNGNGPPVHDRAQILEVITNHGVTNARCVYDTLVAEGAREAITKIVADAQTPDIMGARILLEAAKRGVTVNYVKRETRKQAPQPKAEASGWLTVAARRPKSVGFAEDGQGTREPQERGQGQVA